MVAQKTKHIVKNKEELYSDNISVHSSMRIPLILAQIFGLFPLRGISSFHYNSLQFSWICFRTIYSIICLLLVSFVLLSVVYSMIAIETTINKASKKSWAQKVIYLKIHYFLDNAVFYTCGFCSSVLFIRFARDWPKFMKDWRNVEMTMGSFGIQTNLKKKIKYLTTFIFFFGTGFLIFPFNFYFTLFSVEHILVYIKQMTQVLEKTKSNGIKLFFMNMQYYVFEIFEYSLWKGIIAQVSLIKFKTNLPLFVFKFINIQTTFSWLFIDIIIILLSTAFVMRLTQLRKKIKAILKIQVNKKKIICDLFH